MALPLAYRGEDLGPRPHVAVLFRDQIGDFVVATPLMRGLRERFPDVLVDYFGGERTRELEEASPLVAARYSPFPRPGAIAKLPAFLDRRRAEAGLYALAINLGQLLLGGREHVLPFLRPLFGEERVETHHQPLSRVPGIDHLRQVLAVKERELDAAGLDQLLEVRSRAGFFSGSRRNSSRVSFQLCEIAMGPSPGQLPPS